MKTGEQRLSTFIAVFICSGVLLTGGTCAIFLTTGPSDLLSSLRVAIGILRMKGAPSGPPPALFRRYVLDPIPPSVTEIKAHRTKALFGYGYTFRFKISRSDLGLITQSRPFKRVAKIECTQDNFVNWDWESAPGRTMLVYAPGQRRPRWYRPHTWANPEGYAVPDGEIRILIYNERAGEAYMIIRGKS
jgi:hypothetical protein